MCIVVHAAVVTGGALLAWALASPRLALHVFMFETAFAPCDSCARAGRGPQATTAKEALLSAGAFVCVDTVLVLDIIR